MNILNNKDPDFNLVRDETGNGLPVATDARKAGFDVRFARKNFCGQPVLLVDTVINIGVGLVFAKSQKGRNQ